MEDKEKMIKSICSVIDLLYARLEKSNKRIAELEQELKDDVLQSK